jgi:hypothetical protein
MSSLSECSDSRLQSLHDLLQEQQNKLMTIKQMHAKCMNVEKDKSKCVPIENMMQFEKQNVNDWLAFKNKRFEECKLFRKYT